MPCTSACRPFFCGGHLGCLKIGATVNQLLQRFLHVFVWTPVFFALGQLPSSGRAGP